MSWRKSLLVVWKIFRLFVKTLTTDDKYSLLNRENLMRTIRIQLSKKQKQFFQFFSGFFKSASNIEHFQKKMTLIAYVFSKIRTTGEGVR